MALLLPPLLLLGGVEALYRYGLSRVGELPQAPARPRTELAWQVLWLAEEDAPLQLEPLWPWGLVGLFVEGARLRSSWRRPPGIHLASATARHWLASHPAPEGARRLPWHFRSLVLTVWISRHWSAEELLTAHAQSASFGRDVSGLDAAARRYFGKAPELLSLHEAALLAGIPQAPSRYDPRCRPEAALQRRDFVLSRLHARGWISEDEKEAARRRPLLPHPMHCQE